MSKIEAKNLVLQMTGRPVDVIEATKPISTRARPEHYIPGTECDPLNCTVANAIKEKPDVSLAVVYLTVTYVLFKSDPDHLHRYDNRGKINRLLPTMKLIKSHDAKAQITIPPAGVDIVLFPFPAQDRLAKNMTKRKLIERRKMKNESARLTATKTVRRKYRRSVSGIRQNVLSAFITGAMSNANLEKELRDTK